MKEKIPSIETITICNNCYDEIYTISEEISKKMNLEKEIIGNCKCSYWDLKNLRLTFFRYIHKNK